ncbi:MULTISPECIES: ArsR/SmtB family transcription factor [Micrococcales]|uniref:ArsR/SmtB family transcription factor n=1 Tax=Micrococcales TaxID=85006 RepID=UPI00055A30B7|nr:MULTISPECIES: winged helix-turn-helix domain-containing protein [Micrococcales]
MIVRVYPESVPDISATATALADASRAAMCAALMDGRAWTVGELGNYAGLARSTASEHVDALVAHGIVRDIRQGRHRYIRLAGEDVAHVIECLGALASSDLPTPHSLIASRANTNLREGRTCYQHLAGKLGVSLVEQLQDRDYIDSQWQVTRRGRRLFTQWGVPITMLTTGTPCMDSTERRFHLGGPFGTGLCKALLHREWVARIGRTRAVRLTATGREALIDAGLAPGSPATIDDDDHRDLASL